jgi:hypothetical protein
LAVSKFKPPLTMFDFILCIHAFLYVIILLLPCFSKWEQRLAVSKG